MKYLRAVMGFTRADTLEMEDTRTELGILKKKKKKWNAEQMEETFKNE
jgi:hypothetical protein